MDEDTKNIIGKGLKLVGQLFENDKNNKEVVQCWLEEHRSLRSEIEQHHISMRYIFIFNLTASGTLFSFVLSNVTEFKSLILIIPILSSLHKSVKLLRLCLKRKM
ncbi:hypothetical protein ACFLYR_07850 [Chloroflexota bacterium]